VETETGSKRACDRRRHPRFAEDANALCMTEAGDGGFHQARITEISSDGMRILTGCAFSPGSQLYAGVFLEEEQEPLVLLGVVQHVEADGPDTSLGIRFLSVTDEQQTAVAQLREYLTRRHGGSATVTLRPAAAILRVDEESWW